jgi:hypothetical protein
LENGIASEIEGFACDEEDLMNTPILPKGWKGYSNQG